MADQNAAAFDDAPLHRHPAITSELEKKKPMDMTVET
jgi:hypothetical protein